MAKKIEAFRLSGRVEVDERGAKRALASVEQQAKQTQSTFAKLKTSLLGGGSGGSGSGFLPGLSYLSEIIQGLPQIGALAGALVRPLTDAAQEGIKFNMMLDGARSGFEGVAGGAENARRHVDALQRLANDKRVRFEGVLEAARAMNTYNFTIEEQLTKLPIWMDAVASSGEVTADKIAGVARAFGQMRAKGTVSAEEMEQLAERGIDGWNLLAKAVGMTVGQVRKLSEQGRLNGKISVEIMTEMIAQDSRYQGQLERRGKQLAGQLDLLANISDAAKGMATENLTNDLSGTLEEALKVAPLATMKLAGGINSMISPISGMLKEAAMFALGGSLTEGLSEGINLSQTLVKNAVTNMAQNSVIGTFKGILGIQSPSKVFREMGMNSAEGYFQGLREGFDKFGKDNPLVQFLNDLNNQTKGKRRVSVRDPNAPAGLSNQQYANWARMMALFQREPEFLPKLKELAAARGMNPDHVLNMFAIESSFRKTALNKYGYLGLGQVGRRERRMIGFSGNDAKDRALLANRSATWQLENLVFPFIDLKAKAFGGPLNTMDRLYAAWGSGHASRDANYVHMASKAAGAAFNKRTRAYFANPQWDFNKDGYVRQWEFGQSALKNLGAGKFFSVNGEVIPMKVVASSLPSPSDNGGRDPFVNPMQSVKPVEPSNDVYKEATIVVPEAKFQFKEFRKLIPPLTTNTVTLTKPVRELNSDFDELSDTTKDLAKNAKKAAKETGELSKEQIKKNRRRLPGITSGFFTGRKAEAGDEDGNTSEATTKIQSAMAGLKFAFSELKAMGKEAFSQFAQGVGGIVENFVLMGETGPAAMRKLTAQVLASLAAQAAVKAVFELAEGFAALARWDFAAASNHFTSAAIFGGIAGGAALAGRAVAGNLFNGKGGQQDSQQQQSSEQQGNFSRRAFGGQGFAGRAYIVGDGGRPEVFQPNQDGYIYPGIDAYFRANARNGSMSSSPHSELAQATRELKETISALKAVKAGRVLMKGIREKKGIISRSMANELSSNQGTAMDINRKLGYAI